MSETIILIPCHNSLLGLEKTLKSINHQKGIDILVVDDGSEMQEIPTQFRLKHLLNKGVNLEIIRLTSNCGITEALNHGLDHILEQNKHQFIARIDCGDICVKNRFQIQEDYLNTHPEIDLVGSWVNWVDAKSGDKMFCKKPPTSHKEIKRKMSLRCSVIHPSVMLRYSVVESVGKYPEGYEAAEDYAYFYEIINKTKIANIPKFLTSVEHNTEGISNQQRKLQSKSKLKVIKDHSVKNLRYFYSLPYNYCLMNLPTSTILNMKMKLFKN